MRRAVIALAGLVVLGVANYSIYEKERVLAEGRVIYLELAPIDPRSLMQGDYMALRFAVQVAMPWKETLRDGYVVVKVDDRSVAKFVRIDDGTALAADELRIYYRVRGRDVRFGTNAFFFQEGDAELYNGARYGEARVDGKGQLLLTALRDGELRKLGR